MRKLKILDPFVVIALSLCISNCDNRDPQPITKLLTRPQPIAQDGGFTFAAIINGAPFSFDQFSTTAILRDGLSIDAYSESGWINFFINDAIVQDVPYMMNSGSAHFGDVDYIFSNCHSYTTKADGNFGTVTITKLDEVNFKVSGTFKFSLMLPGCSSIEITDGMFDVKYTH